MVAFVLVSGPAAAHVVISPRSAEVGRPAVLSFWVPECCAGSPTTSLSINIPAPITFAKPQPKSGWTIELEHEKLAEPIPVEDIVQTERVSRITFKGPPVPDSHFEQFVVLFKLPPQAGPLRFPAVQGCQAGVRNWTEVPSAANASTGLRHPAPTLQLTEPR
jgi:uncharacterized protein YcnI